MHIYKTRNLSRFKVQFIFLFLLIYSLFTSISMYGEMTSRNNQAYSRGHLVHNTGGYMDSATACSFASSVIIRKEEAFNDIHGSLRKS